MRSVRAKILLWCFGTLLLSLAAFVWVSTYIAIRNFGRGPGGPEGFNRMQLEEAIDAYQSGGPVKLAAHLDRLRRFLATDCYLTDAHGTDLASGADRSRLLNSFQGHWGVPRWSNTEMMMAVTSRDGRYRMISERPRILETWDYVPYFGLILLAVALLCWLLAVNIASPLRGLAHTVDAFGAGDLEARVNSRRKDEIGELGRAFDRMAGRIATLLTAERRLLQDISHELRSPLARLSFAAELIRTAPDRDAAVARLRKEITRLADLVGALIQVTRAEGELAPGPREDVRLNELLGEVVGDCTVEADARGCRIVLDADKLVIVRGDPELLRRAVENVVRNSIRYTPLGAEIDIRLDSAPGTAHVSVRDYGPGVPEDVLPKIFQPFFRVDESRDSSTGGVGLGLAIAQRAVGLHHGRLWARNARPGLEVCVELPLTA